MVRQINCEQCSFFAGNSKIVTGSAKLKLETLRLQNTNHAPITFLMVDGSNSSAEES